MMLVALNANVSRYFVEYHLGEENLGMFSAMAYVMVAVTGVAEALGQAATPKLARYYADRQIAQFRSLLVKLAVGIVVLGVAGVATAKIGGRILLTLLYTRRYAEHVDVFVWLTVSAAATGVALLLSQGVSAARCFRVQVPMFAAVALASAAGCYLLVPTEGMRGAAIAVAISSLLHVIIATGIVIWILIRPQPQRREARPHAEAGPYPAPALET
jgi:O-antigen/teichoic acid export membrane protein